MTKEDVITLMRAAVLIAGAAAPGIATAAQVVDYLLKQAELTGREAGMSDAEIQQALADAKAERQIADAAWDEVVRCAE